MLDVGNTLDVTIEKLAFQGSGITKPDNFTIFVPRSAPEDRARIEITLRKKHYAYANVREMIEPSRFRIEPPCPYFARCGGCHYQHIQPTKVDEEKIQQLRDTLMRLGSTEVDVRPIVKGSKAWNYRNRVTYRRDVSGHQGYTAWDDFETLDIDLCLIAEVELNQAWQWLKNKISHISPKVLPFVFLRKVGDVIAVIFSVTPDFHAQEIEKLFVDRPEHYYFYTTVVKNHSHTAFGKEFKNLFSAPTYFEQKLGDLFYILQPHLFFQINNDMAEIIVNDVVKDVSTSQEPLIDIYCGSGLFSIAIAKKNIPVLGVEVQHQAILSAKQSAIRNSVDELARFRTGKAERILERLAQEGERFTRAIVDPPRDGLQPDLLNNLQKLGIRTIYYVSCSPPTLARDVKELTKLGFNVDYCQPYEMFPQTYHIEAVTKLTKTST